MEWMAPEMETTAADLRSNAFAGLMLGTPFY
jgi:hypothetical protein